MKDLKNRGQQNITRKYRGHNDNRKKNKGRFSKLLFLIWSTVRESFLFALYVIFKSLGMAFMGLARLV